MTRRKKVPLDYDPRELHRDLDAAYGRAWQLAQDFVKDPEYYVTLDGASKAFYGTGYRYLGKGKKERKERMSIAGLNTTGAFRGKKGNQRGTPMYRGTESKIDWFQVVAHLYESKASFPLAVRRGLVSADSIKEFVDVIDKLPRKPAMILGDKEFCNHKKTQDLRPACDRWGTILLVAAPRTVATVKMVNAAWHNGQAKRMPFGRKIAFWAAQQHVWADHGKVRNTLLTFYFHEDPRKDKQLNDESLMRLPSGLWAISFLVNVEVDDENAAWILARYSDRWSI